MALLVALPYLRLNLADAPEPLLHALFEAARLMINLNEGSDDVTVRVGLRGDSRLWRTLRDLGLGVSPPI